MSRKHAQVRRFGASQADRPAHRRDLLSGTALGALVAVGLFAFSAPSLAQVSGLQGGVVVGGQATIANTAPGHVTITQTTNRGVIDWRSFSIGAGERVDFLQPGTSSVTLNRVTGPDPSVIAGQLNATGQLILVNGAGVVFANGAQVNAAGLVAATSTLTDPQRFMRDGTINFDRASSNPNAGVTNAGTITVRDGGLVGLVGNTASNSGTINARLGRVHIAGAETFTVDLAGDGLINFQVGSPVSRQPVDSQGRNVALASNSGTINADGGTVQLTARAARGVVDNVVNAGGTINARAVRNEGGVVVFGADDGTLNVTGTVDVSGNGAGQRGGQVVATGARATVNVAASANINASGHSGGGRVNIGGNRAGQGPLANARDTSVATGARIAADAMARGDGGTVIVWADNATVFGGTITAKGGASSGNGGFVEVSGKQYLDYAGLVDVRAANGATGTLLLDPANINIQNNGVNNTSQTGGDPNIITGNANTSILTVATLQAALASANVVVDAANSPGTAVGTITVNDPITSTSGNSLTFRAAANIDLNNNAINIGTGTLAFFSTGGNLNGGGGALTASAVTFNMSGNVALNNANNNFASISGTAGGTINVRTTGALDVTGLMAGDNVTLRAGGNLLLSGSIITPTVGNGVFVSLRSDNGTITQNANVGITTRELRVLDTAGNVSLLGGANAVVQLGQVNANASAFAFANSGNLTITDTGTADAGYSVMTTGTLTINGGSRISADNGTVRLQGTSLTTNSQIDGANVTLIANQIALNQNVNVGAGGTAIIAPMTAGTAVTLGQSGTPLGLVIDNPELLRLSSAAVLIVGQTDAGATTAGSIQFGAATVGNATLNLFTSGGITQSALLTVNAGAGTLNVTAGGTVDLNGPGANVATVGGSTTAGNFLFLKSGVGPGALVVSGITTAGGEIAVRNFLGNLTIAGAVSSGGGTIVLGSNNLAASALNINADIDAGAGSVALFASSGGIAQGGGKIVAGNLLAGINGSVNGAIALGSAANQVSGNVTINAGSASGNISFANTSGYTVGGLSSITTTLGTFAAPLGSGIRAGAGATVTLTAGGTIAQASGVNDIVATGTLSIARLGSANPNVTLNNANNTVTTLGAVTLGTGAFAFANTGNLTIAGAGSAGSYSVTTTATMVSPGDIALMAPITSPGTVTLFSTGGAVFQATAAGTVTAAALQAQAASFVDLGNLAANSVGTFAASAGGGNVRFVNTGMLTVDSVTTSDGTTSGVTAANGNVTLSTTGELRLANAVTADSVTGIVSLVSTGGSVGELTGGRVVAAGLEVRATNLIFITQPLNSVGALGFAAFSTSGAVQFTNQTAILLTQVGQTSGVTAGSQNIVLQAASGNISQTANGLVTIANGLLVAFALNGDIVLDRPNAIGGSFLASASGNVTLRNTGDIVIGLNGSEAAGITASTAAGAFVSLISDTGMISQIAGPDGRIIGNELRLATMNKNAILTNPGNEIAVLGNTSLGSGKLALVDSTGDLTINGPLVVTGGIDLRASGKLILNVNLPAGAGDITLQSGADLLIGQAITTTGTVSLISTGGSVLQSTAAGIITATALRANAAVDVTLGTLASNSVGIFAASATAGDVTFINSGMLTIGTVMSAAGTTIGVMAASGDITLQSGGDLLIGQGISTTTGTVSLASLNGSVLQTTAAGIITAAALQVNAARSIGLGAMAPNSVGIFAASATNGDVTFVNNGTLTIGTVTSAAGTTSGVTALNSNVVSLAAMSGGDLIIARPINAGPNNGLDGFISLNAAGSIIQNAMNASLVGGRLLAWAGVNVDLFGAGNTISTGQFAAFAGGNVAFRNDPRLVVALMRDTGGNDVAGIRAGGAVTLQSGGDVLIDQVITTTTGTVSLTSLSGSVLQTTAAGIITAAALQATAAVDVALDQAANNVGTFAAQANRDVLFSATGALTIGTVGGTSGVTAGRDVALFAGGDLSLLEAVVTDRATGVVGLFSTNGSIRQTGMNGTVTGVALEAVAAGEISLGMAANRITGLAASAGRFITFANTGTLVVGQVNDTVGVVAQNGNVTLTSVTGDLVVNRRVVAGGATGIASLTSTAGSIFQDMQAQTGDVLISAFALEARAAGGIDLGLDLSAVLTIAASAGTGSVVFANVASLTIGTVNMTNGVMAANGHVTFSTRGDLLIDAPVVASSATGIVRLIAAADSDTTGVVIQLRDSASVTAGALEVRARGVIDMTADNVVGTFAASTTFGDVTFINRAALTIGTVGGTSGVTASGDIRLSALGNLTLAADVVSTAPLAPPDVSTSLVSLFAFGDINQTGGMIRSQNLIAIALGNIDLPSATNTVTVVSAGTEGGRFRLRTAGALTVGGFDGFDGITTFGGDVAIHAGGDLNLAAAIDTTDAMGNPTNAIVRLQATNGNVTQDPRGGIFAGTLLVNTIGSGNVMLNSPDNRIQGTSGAGVVVGTSAGSFMVTSGNPNTLTNVSVAGDAGLAIIGFMANVPPPPPPPGMDPPPGNQPPPPLMLINNCYVEGSQSCEQQPADPPGVEGLEMLRTLTISGPTQVNFRDSGMR